VHPTVRVFEAAQLKQQSLDFRAGDTVRVSVRIVEGEKERVQDYEGVCIRRRGGGAGETFTVRRYSYGVGMERIFPLNSPRIENVKVIRRGKVRRANLGYLRKLRGKKARITEDLLRSRKMFEQDRARKERDVAAQAQVQQAAPEEGQQES